MGYLGFHGDVCEVACPENFIYMVCGCCTFSRLHRLGIDASFWFRGVVSLLHLVSLEWD